MDIKTGLIYPSLDEAERDLRLRGVPEGAIRARLITGTKPTLRKLRKMIRKQHAKQARHG